MAGSERELVQRAIGGDRAALTELFERHGPTVRQLVAKRYPNRWRPLLSEDDVMQQTYADAFRGIGRFVASENGTFAGWLASLARCNLQDAIRMLQADKRPDRHVVHAGRIDGSFVALCDLLSGTGSTPSGHFERKEARTDLEQAIEELPDDYRRVVRMYDLEDQTISQVTQALNRSAGAVYMLRARAHDRLREILGSASNFFTIA